VTTIDHILDTIHNTTDQLTALEQLRTRHIQQGGTNSGYLAAATDLIAIRYQEATTPTEQAQLGELAIQLNRGIALDYAALLGLWEAFTTYQPGAGRFSSWAYRVVTRHVQKAVATTEYPTLSQSDFEKRGRVMKAVKQLTTETHTPTLEEIAHTAKVTRTATARVLNPTQTTSLDKYRGNPAQNLSLSDLIPAVDNVEQQVLDGMYQTDTLERLTRILTPRELHVVVRRCSFDGLEPENNAQIGARLGVTREQVRKLFASALIKIERTDLTEKMRDQS
jgi:RNA polymerase sigma factor (sigma-70 family)